MGSIAPDRDGNMALGYSLSGTPALPTTAHTGRLGTERAAEHKATNGDKARHGHGDPDGHTDDNQDGHGDEPGDPYADRDRHRYAHPRYPADAGRLGHAGHRLCHGHRPDLYRGGC